MMHSTTQELRLLSDDEVLAVSGGKGKGNGPADDKTLPKPPPTTGSTAGMYLYPLIYKMN